MREEQSQSTISRRPSAAACHTCTCNVTACLLALVHECSPFQTPSLIVQMVDCTNKSVNATHCLLMTSVLIRKMFTVLYFFTPPPRPSSGSYVCWKFTCILSSGYFCYGAFCAAAPNITCPAAFRTEVTESLTRIVRGFGSLPMTIIHTPAIGSMSGMNVASPFSVIWSLSGSLPQLMLGQNVSVTWNVSYVDTACSSVTGQPTVLANCLAVPTSSSCTTNVLLVSKLSNYQDYLFVV